MPTNKKQLLRLIKFVAELKQNNYPNTETFAKTLRNLDLQENINISCGRRTILRDVKVLINDFKAPIAFDAEKGGYYLTNHYWEFQCPLFPENMIFTSMLAIRLAEDIVPEPLKSMMKSSIENQLTRNNSEFLDDAFINSFIIASGVKVVIEPSVFKTIFDGWRYRRAVEITYQEPNVCQFNCEFEPHILAFYNGIWYTKGIELPSEEEKAFGLHCVKDARLMDGMFEINKNLLENVRENGLFDYPKIDGVKLLCDASTALYVYEHPQAKDFKIETLENGDLSVTLSSATECELIPWILGAGGNIKVLSPDFLKEKILLAGKKIAANGVC